MNLDLTFIEPADALNARLTGVRRVEATFEAQDGQQFKAMLLDADDSYDMVVVGPNGDREVVWSLVKEQPEGELFVTEGDCPTCGEAVWSDGSCSLNCPRNGEHEVAA